MQQTEERRRPVGGGAVLAAIVSPTGSASAWAQNARLLQQSGFGLAQLDLPLSRINPRDGRFEWDYGGFETGIQTLYRAGVLPVLKFLGQADYLSSDPNGPHSDWDNSINLTPPRDRTQWQTVVRQVVARYRQSCRHWQIGNEPDGGGYFRGNADEYMTYLEWTASAIRAVQPNAVILAGELYAGQLPAGSYGDVLSKLVRRPDLFDVLAVHYPIGRPQDSGPIEDYQRAMQRAGIRKPIWNTEQAAGASCEGAAPGTSTHIRTEGATQLSPMKAVGHCVGLGMEKVFLMHWNYDDSGIAYRDWTQAECRATAWALNGAIPVRQRNFGNRDLSVYLFRRADGRRVIAFWTEVQGVTVPLRILSSQKITVVNHRDERQELTPSGGWVRVTARFCPQMAVVADPTTDVQLG